MKKTYERASQTIIWLGEGDNNTVAAFDLTERVAARQLDLAAAVRANFERFKAEMPKVAQHIFGSLETPEAR